MHINKTPISSLGASLSEKLIKPTPSNTQTAIVGNSVITLDIDKAPKILYLKILFQAKTREEIEKNISTFSSLCSDIFIIELPNRTTFFKCFPSNIEVEETGINEWLYITANFPCVEFSYEKVSILEDVLSKAIEVGGNDNVDCIVEITPKIDMIELLLYGLSEDVIKISNLRANKKIIINAEEGKVKVDGNNFIENVDLWEFPSLKPGTNTIRVDKSNCKIEIKFKERWV